MDKYLKQYFHNKPTQYTWEILPISASVTQPELCFIKCDDAGTRLASTTSYVFKATSVRLDNATVIIENDTFWFELSEDNIFQYDGAAVTDIELFYGTLTGVAL